MNKGEIENLRSHTEQICLALIREANPDGIIRTENSDGTTSSDIPASFHLAEVLSHLSSEIFFAGVVSVGDWLMNPANGFSQHPFALNAMVLTKKKANFIQEALEKSILTKQLKDGSIPVFNSYLPGGDFFSTLWAIKILSTYSTSIFEREINLALDYLIKRKDIGYTKSSQVGFLGLLLSKIKPEDVQTIEEIGKFLVTELNKAFDDDSLLLVDRLFILEDLLFIDSGAKKYQDIIDDNMSRIFSLSETATQLPTIIQTTRDKYSESLFLETLARCAIIGILKCQAEGINDIAYTVNQYIHNDYRDLRYKALRTTASLRAFLEKYGTIHEAFSSYNDRLELAWKLSDFDKTIFLMMPFQSDNNYRTLTATIKQICLKKNFSAIRIDDKDRQFSDRLWDNLVINMLSSKYAIAIYVSEPIVDILTKKDEVKFFANPNVALEFGFLKSRGQNILLLKDKNSPLPSDLQGFLWKEFDIKNPDTTIPKHIETWLETITKIQKS